jgi:hypothetical protein
VFELGTGGPGNIYRDPNTQLLGANQQAVRFDPNKDIIYYFAPGMPDSAKTFFDKTVKPATNDVLMKAGAKGRLNFLSYNDKTTLGDGMGPARKFGDVRYSFIVWHSDVDNGSQLLGVAQFNPDQRTGQLLTASVNVFEGTFKDAVEQRLDLFLQTVGAEWLTADKKEFDDSKYPSLPCTEGATVPLADANITKNLNSSSTVYGKIQAYLQKPVSQFGNLALANFLPKHDTDFYNAYYSLLPYIIYADPMANRFVTPDGDVFGTTAMENWKGLQKLAEFDQLAAGIDHGEIPWAMGAADSVDQALAFNHKVHQLTQAVQDYEAIKARNPLHARSDDIGLFSYLDIYQKNGRHCVNGAWEKRADYTTRLINTLNNAVALHEFGHTLGLRHNFMGSVDQRNYVKDQNGNVTLYSSSIMDYNQQIVEAFYQQGWPTYDAAALGFIYGNNQDMASAGPQPASGTPTGISGQVSSTAPWKDPLGFQADGTTEIPFLYCSDEHTTYTPLCRPYDMGATPSEIMSNEIQQREWNYLWTNFRLYHKFFSLGSYGQGVARDFTAYRRFLSLWNFDWSAGELSNTLRLVGIKPPPGTTAGDYYTQLTGKFNMEVSMANSLSAAYHRAIIDQASGERPFITVFDPFYGDTTQQGIQLDKVIAIDSFSSLWPAISNYDPSQAGGFLLTSAAGEDPTYNALANGVLLDFLGAAFATYTYSQVGPLAAFAEETHSTMWPGDSRMRSWVGNLTFDRERDFLDFLHGIAVRFGFQNCDENGGSCDPCTSIDHCTWDPRMLQMKPQHTTQSDRYNVFTGPDGRTYIWMYLQSRNQWILADKDRNVATYTLMLGYTTDVVNAEDDGYNGAQALESKVRFAIDAFNKFDDDQTATH